MPGDTNCVPTQCYGFLDYLPSSDEHPLGDASDFGWTWVICAFLVIFDRWKRCFNYVFMKGKGLIVKL